MSKTTNILNTKISNNEYKDYNVVTDADGYYIPNASRPILTVKPLSGSAANIIPLVANYVTQYGAQVDMIVIMNADTSSILKNYSCKVRVYFMN